MNRNLRINGRVVRDVEDIDADADAEVEGGNEDNEVDEGETDVDEGEIDAKVGEDGDVSNASILIGSEDGMDPSQKGRLIMIVVT
jgi:hypothetical protein